MIYFLRMVRSQIIERISCVFMNGIIILLSFNFWFEQCCSWELWHNYLTQTPGSWKNLFEKRPPLVLLKHYQWFLSQGVAKAFSIAYHKVDSKRKTLRITESAISWICRRSESVHEINVYLVEPDGKNEDYVLRRMMLAQGEKEVKSFDMPSRLKRKENLFRWVNSTSILSFLMVLTKVLIVRIGIAWAGPQEACPG